MDEESVSVFVCEVRSGHIGGTLACATFCRNKGDSQPVLGVHAGAVERGNVYVSADAEHNALVFRIVQKTEAAKAPFKKPATAGPVCGYSPLRKTRTTQNPPVPSRRRGRAKPAWLKIF